jgi:hypothetical protein
MSGKRGKFGFPTLATAILILSIFSPISVSQATETDALVTCINLDSGTERISRTGKCRYIQEAQANWHKNRSDSSIASGPTVKSLLICSNKVSSPVSYQVIRSKCARHQVATIFSRSGSLPAKPVIAQAVSYGYDSSRIELAEDLATNLDAPVAFYTIYSSKGNTQKVHSWRDLSLVISGLQALTTYTFIVTATTVDGTSPVSAASIPVTTPAYVAPAPAPVAASPLAAPAFTLSSSSENRTVSTTATGFTISSTGGAIASFAINATPPGMSFSNDTGALSGTPNTVASATAYTVTATNASGSATAIFTLTVTAVVYTVGQTGPGGGTIFYVAPSPFSCGPTRSATCTYLEAAPAGWNADVAETTRRWANTSFQGTVVGSTGSPETATATAIGWGYSNTRAIISQGNTETATSAAALADSHTVTVGGVVVADWYLPSQDELNQMCKWQRGITGDALTTLTTVCTGGTLNTGIGAAGFEGVLYWPSTEASWDRAWVQNFFNGDQYADTKFDNYRVRPIRAF